MSDLCEQPKETLYHYIKDQPALKGLKINTDVILGKCQSKWQVQIYLYLQMVALWLHVSDRNDNLKAPSRRTCVGCNN